MGCMGFGFADAIAPCGHDIQKNTFAVIKNRSHNRTVWTALYTWDWLNYSIAIEQRIVIHLYWRIGIAHKWILHPCLQLGLRPYSLHREWHNRNHPRNRNGNRSTNRRWKCTLKGLFTLTSLCSSVGRASAGVASEVKLRECTSCTPLPSANKAPHSGLETQRRCHQKSKTGVLVAPQKALMCSKNLKRSIRTNRKWKKTETIVNWNGWESYFI